MKIPEDEIETVKIVCRSLKNAIDENAPLGDVPLTIISNPFPNFVWLKYHPSIAVGGVCTRMSKSVVIYDYALDQLMWWNTENANGVLQAGWHPIRPENDELVEMI